MTDEKDMLLKVGVDAAGVAKGVAEVKTGLREMDAASKTAGPAAAPETTAALKSQAEATHEAAEATEKLGESAGISRVELMNLAATVGGVDPRLAQMIRMAYRARGAMQLMFSPVGLGIAAIAGAFVALTATIGKYIALIDEAKRKWQELMRVEEEARRRRRGEEEVTAGGLAKAGIVDPEAIAKATAAERRLRRAGYSAEAAAAVSPFAVGPGGQPAMTEQEAEDLAAMQEMGAADLGIKGPGDVQRVRDRNLRKARQQRDAVNQWKAAAAARAQRRREDALHGDREAIKQQLGLTGEAVEDQDVQDIIDIQNEGFITPSEGANFQWQQDRMEWESRQRRAAERARRLGLINPEQFGKASGRTAMEQYGRSWRRAINEQIPGLVTEEGRPGIMTIGQQPAGQRQLSWPEIAAGRAGQPQVVNNNFHGPTYVGRPGDRFVTRERFPQ